MQQQSVFVDVRNSKDAAGYNDRRERLEQNRRKQNLELKNIFY